MSRKNFFRVSAILSCIIFLTLYSYFWYSAGVYSFKISFKNNFIGLIIFLVLSIISIVTSNNNYLEKKHSIIFASLYGLPIILGMIMLTINGGEILESSLGFAYTTFALLILVVIIYFISIFVSE